ncbi:MAG: hypothetical protein K8T25_02240 [Planctomycetia bacterium]|nr:hypothetical protein [Planctomycetia bacterium]
MTENPYQSPSSSDLDLADSSDVPAAERRGRGPLAMASLGLLLGSAAGGITGACGAAVLAGAFLTLGHSQAVLDGELPMVCGFLGGFFGAGGGGVWGVVAGLWAGTSRAGIRRRFVWTVAIVSLLYGSVIGWAGGAVVYNRGGLPASGYALTATLWAPIGALIGAVAGLLGGWLFSRRLAAACWGESSGAKRVKQ